MARLGQTCSPSQPSSHSPALEMGKPVSPSQLGGHSCWSLLGACKVESTGLSVCFLIVGFWPGYEPELFLLELGILHKSFYNSKCLSAPLRLWLTVIVEKGCLFVKSQLTITLINTDCFWGNKIDRQIKVPAAKAHDLSSIPGNYMVGRETHPARW